MGPRRKRKKEVVDPHWMRLVDDLDSFNTYPWGRLAYKEVLFGLQKDLGDRFEEVMNLAKKRKRDPKFSGFGSLHLSGFVQSLQILAYEFIMVLVRLLQLVERMQTSHCPGWHNNHAPSLSDVAAAFSSSRCEDVCGMLTLTDAELLSAHYILGDFVVSNECAVTRCMSELMSRGLKVVCSQQCLSPTPGSPPHASPPLRSPTPPCPPHSTRSVLGKCVYLVTLAMLLFDLQDVCIVIGSIATLDLPMVVDLIGIYGLKGPYCTLTTTNWFLQELSVIPRGSWGDVDKRFTMIRWASPEFRPSLSSLKPPPPPPRVARIRSGQLDEENPFVQNLSVLLVQADKGVSVLVMDRIGDIYRSLPRRADVIVTTVGARHKCQQGSGFEPPMYVDNCY
ncbi:hypothetical protein F511_35326 [Dorcoceras hygrometricum]|uniref:Uncharacterized protein n=1 Tax=Dorcoceras hygrometricum TaxID=472368 RepID=A0A2Z7DGC9_9LAMI|nr:hypothetical protein F511_35326 [Dorcoceras hygrometricum]